MKNQTIVLLVFLTGISLKLTGQITHIGNFEYAYYCQDMVFSPNDTVIYSLQNSGSDMLGTDIDRLYCNSSSGMIESKVTVVFPGILRRINRSFDGRHYYVLNQAGKILCLTPDLVQLSIFNDTISELSVNGDIEITKKGEHIYLPCSNGIYILNRDSTSGDLSLNSFIKDDTLGNNRISDLRGLKISNNDKFIYAISHQDSAINVFSRDTNTGFLNCIQTITEFADEEPLVSPLHMDLSPKNDFLILTASSTIISFLVDSISGLLSYDTSLVGSFSSNITDIEISNDNTYFFVTEILNKKLHVFRKDNIIHNSMRYIGEVQKFEKDAFTYDWDGPNQIRISADMKNIYVSQKYANTQLNYFRIYNFGLPVDIGQDLLGCYGDSININATDNNYVSYLWEDGTTNSFRYVNEEGEYSVKVTDGFGRTGIDTVHVDFLTVEAEISGEEHICNGDSVILTAKGGSSYTWNNGFNDSIIGIAPAYDTTIIVTAMLFNCYDEDTITIKVLPSPQMTLGEDIIIENDTSVMINSDSNFESYLWSNNSTEEYYKFDASVFDIGKYIVWLEVKNEHGCGTSDTIAVNVVEATNIGLNDYFSGEKRLEIFPNPNNGSFEINLQMVGQVNIKLVEPSGKIVTELKVNNIDLNERIVFSNVKAGLYIIQVSSEKEEYSSKILIQ